MSNENPNPRETFDKNEAGIAQTKKAIAEAVTAGDYDKVGALAQEAKNMETSNLEMSTVSQEATDDNKAFGEAKAAEERARKDTERAEQSRLQAEKDSQEAAALLAKLQGGATESSPTANAETVAIENAEPATAQTESEPLHDAHVKKFESVAAERTEYLKKEIDRFVSTFNSNYKGADDDMMLRVDRKNPDSLRVWIKSMYDDEVRTRKNAEATEKSRQYRHVDKVKNAIYSQNRDVAERMEKLMQEGHTLGQITDDLVSPPSWVKNSQTPEYKKVANSARDEIVRLDNVDYEKTTNPENLTRKQLLTQRDEYLKTPSQEPTHHREIFKDFSLQGTPELKGLIPLPEIPEEIKVGELKALLNKYKEDSIASIG